MNFNTVDNERLLTMYQEGDRIELKNGKTATIVEVLGEGKMYVADIDLDGDWDTVFVKPEEIKHSLD